MKVEVCNSILYSDTLIPDVFINEYMPSSDGDSVKIYLYCLFLSKYKKQINLEELSKKLGLEEARVKDCLFYWESLGVIQRNENGINMIDLKEKEINRIFRYKSTSAPEDALLGSERNKKRNAIISAINSCFFQGLMSPSWYNDIDAWFNRYKFEEDVMYALFNHCNNHRGLYKNYIQKVAEVWYNRGIRNSFQLDSYFVDYQKFKDIRQAIAKKLKISRPFTEYEEEMVERWVIDYKYGFDIIEIALKKTTLKLNPNFKFIDAIIIQWHENGLKAVDEITQYEQTRKTRAKDTKDTAGTQLKPNYANFDQRKYDEDFYNNLVENLASNK